MGWTKKEYDDRLRVLRKETGSVAKATRQADREARDANNRAAEDYRKQQEGER